MLYSHLHSSEWVGGAWPWDRVATRLHVGDGDHGRVALARAQDGGGAEVISGPELLVGGDGGRAVALAALAGCGPPAELWSVALLDAICFSA